MTGKYGSLTTREAGVEYEASSAEPVQVVLSIKLRAETTAKVEVAGVVVAELATPGGLTVGGMTMNVTFVVPPGEKWMVPASSSVESIKSSYLTV